MNSIIFHDAHVVVDGNALPLQDRNDLLATHI
jgi:hypothetical protein